MAAHTKRADGAGREVTYGLLELVEHRGNGSIGVVGNRPFPEHLGMATGALGGRGVLRLRKNRRVGIFECHASLGHEEQTTARQPDGNSTAQHDVPPKQVQIARQLPKPWG